MDDTVDSMLIDPCIHGAYHNAPCTTFKAVLKCGLIFRMPCVVDSSLFDPCMRRLLPRAALGRESPCMAKKPCIKTLHIQHCKFIHTVHAIAVSVL